MFVTSASGGGDTAGGKAAPPIVLRWHTEPIDQTDCHWSFQCAYAQPINTAAIRREHASAEGFQLEWHPVQLIPALNGVDSCSVKFSTRMINQEQITGGFVKQRAKCYHTALDISTAETNYYSPVQTMQVRFSWFGHLKSDINANLNYLVHMLVGDPYEQQTANLANLSSNRQWLITDKCEWYRESLHQNARAGGL